MLLNQRALFDEKRTIAQVLQRFGQERLNGTEVRVAAFVRWEVSEGVKKVESDIAADVQKVLHEYSK